MDAEDLYYYRARYYDPRTQRFLSKDPIEFEAGDFNFYRYVGNDPLNFVDPSGLLKGPGGTGGVTDSIGSTAGKGKDGYDKVNSVKACLEKAKRMCPDDIGAWEAANGRGECYAERVEAEDYCRNMKSIEDKLKGMADPFDLGWADKPSSDNNTSAVKSNTTDTNTTGRQSSDAYGAYTEYDKNGSVIKFECTHY